MGKATQYNFDFCAAGDAWKREPLIQFFNLKYFIHDMKFRWPTKKLLWPPSYLSVSCDVSETWCGFFEGHMASVENNSSAVGNFPQIYIYIYGGRDLHHVRHLQTLPLEFRTAVRVLVYPVCMVPIYVACSLWCLWQRVTDGQSSLHIPYALLSEDWQHEIVIARW